MRPDGKTEEVSLIEVFQRAPEFKGLAGELPTQDIAVLRFLLAILHSVFDRYNLDGELVPIFEGSSATPMDALKRWRALWDRGSFPTEIIEKYLMSDSNKDRFYLFHPETPFYQVNKTKGTKGTVAKLNGELSESNNDIRLFPQRTGIQKSRMQFSEVARWLLYINAFDDVSGSGKGRNETKTLTYPLAWLGRLGLLIAIGETLFETLVMNLVLLQDGEDRLWEEGKPVWEYLINEEESEEIAIPNNPSALLTVQSRRIRLWRDENKKEIIGYSLYGGDFFSEENAFSEQQTVWKTFSPNKNAFIIYLPKKFNPTRQVWRDFSSLVEQSDSSHKPGVVSWLSRLKNEGLILKPYFIFQAASVIYNRNGIPGQKIVDIYSDSLQLNSSLLKRANEDWVVRIIEEIKTTELLVNQLGYLVRNLTKAMGDRNSEGNQDSAKEQAYFRLDNSFREWLEMVNPDLNNIDESCDLWWNVSQRIVRELGKELVMQAGLQAFVGRDVEEKNVKRFYSSAGVYNTFLYKTSSREALKGEK